MGRVMVAKQFDTPVDSLRSPNEAGEAREQTGNPEPTMRAFKLGHLFGLSWFSQSNSLVWLAVELLDRVQHEIHQVQTLNCSEGATGTPRESHHVPPNASTFPNRILGTLMVSESK